MEAATTPADSPTAIKPINKGAVHRICAGQVILDLTSAVKELVENSLDAGATSIEIALKEYGEEWFRVIDNGSGISPNNFKVSKKSSWVCLVGSIVTVRLAQCKFPFIFGIVL
jgi:hypothetical protein